ncbi:MAG: hypothetical protein P4N59_05345, partial [Negativicutes bacterium]|nr:hypothetical protein [Negativicutes bacterium]
LLRLPPCGSGTASTGPGYPRGKTPTMYAQIPRPQAPTRHSAKLEKKQQPAMAYRANQPRVVVDYLATISGSYSTATTLAGDTTYHVTGAVYFNAPVTIEGGAVIKYDSGTSITLSSSVTCATSMYRPAFFTAATDCSVGEVVSTNSLASTGYANPALILYLLSSPTLSNLHFSYAKEAVQVVYSSGVSATVSHSQFYHCLQGIELSSLTSGSSVGSGMALTLKNDLFAYANLGIVADNSYNGTGLFYSCTFDNVKCAFQYPPSSSSSSSSSSTTTTTSLGVTPLSAGGGSNPAIGITAKNSLFSNVSALTTNTSGSLAGGYNAFYSSSTFGSPAYSPSSSPYASMVGGGAYYLSTNSMSTYYGLQNYGTTNIPLDLVTDLTLRTTFPPVYTSGTISQSTAWGTNAPRDNDGAPDIGYHYDSLDYLATNVSLAGTLSWSNGVAVGVMGNYGFNLQTGAGISSIGTPNVLNRACFYGNVQESRTNSPVMALAEINGATGNNLWFRFTDIAMGAGNVSCPVLLITNNTVTSGSLGIRDSQVRGCNLSLAPTGTGSAFVLGVTNNFIQRSAVSVTEAAGVPFSAIFYNNLFLNDTLAVNYTNSASNPVWNIQDNLFDATPQTVGGTTAYIGLGCNAFTLGCTNILGGTNCLTNITANFATGPLGSYYYPTNGGPTNLVALIHAGSTTADQLELYHYTVTTNLVNNLEVKETNSTVSIGLHYVATDAYGNPIDTTGDGIPDYLKDSNGNGKYDASDFENWLIGRFNGLSSANILSVFTPLR